MDDQFEDRLVYSSDSDDNEVEKNENFRNKSDPIETPVTLPSLGKQIDEILGEVEQRPSSIDDDEPIFSGVGKKSKRIVSSDDDSDAAAALPDCNEETEKTDNSIIDDDEERAMTGSIENLPAPIRSSIWDSDSSSSDDRAKDEPTKNTKKKVQKIKKKKQDIKKRIVQQVDSDGDMSNTSDNGKRRKNSRGEERTSESSCDTDAEATVNDSTPLPPREKGIQRVSASTNQSNYFLLKCCFYFFRRCQPKPPWSR